MVDHDRIMMGSTMLLYCAAHRNRKKAGSSNGLQNHGIDDAVVDRAFKEVYQKARRPNTEEKALITTTIKEFEKYMGDLEDSKSVEKRKKVNQIQRMMRTAEYQRLKAEGMKDSAATDRRKLMMNLKAFTDNSEEAAERKEVRQHKLLLEELEMVSMSLRDVKHACKIMSRDFLEFKIQVHRWGSEQSHPKITVTNTKTKDISLLESFDFLVCAKLIMLELKRLITCVLVAMPFVPCPRSDPMCLFFHHYFQIGSADIALRELAYRYETDDDDKQTPFRCILAPFGQIGSIQIGWSHADAGKDKWDEDGVSDPLSLLGQPLEYKLDVTHLVLKATDKASTMSFLDVESVYFSYVFDGELFISNSIPIASRSGSKVGKPQRYVYDSDTAFEAAMREYQSAEHQLQWTTTHNRDSLDIKLLQEFLTKPMRFNVHVRLRPTFLEQSLSTSVQSLETAFNVSEYIKWNLMHDSEDAIHWMKLFALQYQSIIEAIENGRKSVSLSCAKEDTINQVMVMSKLKQMHPEYTYTFKANNTPLEVHPGGSTPDMIVVSGWKKQGSKLLPKPKQRPSLIAEINRPVKTKPKLVQHLSSGAKSFKARMSGRQHSGRGETRASFACPLLATFAGRNGEKWKRRH
jgi:hypothetical protein